MPADETPSPDDPRRETAPGDIALSRTLARLSDDLVRIPGTELGIGVDAIVGLVPGVGDLVGTGLSGAIMVDAVRQRVPLTIVSRMGWNLLVDTGLGFLPVVGDAADVLHRVNRKNYRLLEQAVTQGRRVDTDVRGYLVRATLLVTGFITVSLTLVGVAVWALLRVLGLVN